MSMHNINSDWLAWLWQTTWQTALLTVVVGCIARLFRRWISPGARQALWLLVFVRLAMPALPASPLSIWGLNAKTPAQPTVSTVRSFQTSNITPIPSLDRALPATITAPVSSWSEPGLWTAFALLAGTMFCFAHSLISTFRFARVVRRTSQQPDASVITLINECSRHARIRHVGAVLTDCVATPALFGVIRPTLLLPPGVVATLDRESLRNVILHELQHLKRHHLAMDWLLTAVRAIHWFNPAAWIAHRNIRAARELICDQAVILNLENADAPSHYGQTLLTIASGALRSNEPALIAAFARDHTLLRERIETIAHSGKRKPAGLGFLLAILIAAAFLTSPSRAQQAPPTTEPAKAAPRVNATTEVGEKPADVAVNAALNRKLPEIRLDNVAFRDVIEFLRDVSGQNVYVNWKALEAAGVDRNATITARMKEVPFSKVLETILADVGGAGVKLKYVVDDGVITISTEADLGSNVLTRVYDVRDLVEADAGDPKLRQDLVNQIIKLIEDIIAPDSWTDHGGQNATIRELPGSAQLIIVQTPENHLRLRALLDQLRETRALQIKVDAQFLEVPAKVAAEIERQLKKSGPTVLDDFMVRGIVGADGVRVIGKPALIAFNGQAVAFSVDGEKETVALHFQATVSSDRKYVTITPSMLYSTNSPVTAEEQMHLGNILTAYTEAQIATINARQQFGPNAPELMKAQLREEAVYALWQESVKTAIARQVGAANQAGGTKPAEQWNLSPYTISIPDGGTLLMKDFKHSIIQIKPDGTQQTTDAGPGDKVIWLLLRPSVIIQREKEQEQFPLVAH